MYFGKTCVLQTKKSKDEKFHTKNLVKIFVKNGINRIL